MPSGSIRCIIANRLTASPWRIGRTGSKSHRAFANGIFAGRHEGSTGSERSEVSRNRNGLGWRRHG